MSHFLPSKKQPSSFPHFLGLFLVILFVFFLGWSAGINYNKNHVSDSDQKLISNSEGKTETVDMQLFWDAWDILSRKYVDPVTLDTQKMVYGAIHGMVASLGDPYTAFMTPKENKEFQDSLGGSLEGIGAELTLRHGMITVISPLKNSPAQKAGLLPEDIIYKIEDEVVENMSLEEAVKKIRGPKGTAVHLSVLRKNSEEPVDLTIIRQQINIKSVEWKVKDDIAIVEVNQFGDNTEQEFSRMINDVLKQGVKGMILDLRFNGGGYLDGAVDMASEFIEEGKVVTIKRRNPEEDEVIYVNGTARLTSLPLVVLINKGSASASEIVAGAIQDHERGYVIGETSFGKGTVQEVQNLMGGSSLRITVAKWFTAGERDINASGIIPDQIVEKTAEDFEKGNEPQLEAAMNYLKEKIE